MKHFRCSTWTFSAILDAAVIRTGTGVRNTVHGSRGHRLEPAAITRVIDIPRAMGCRQTSVTRIRNQRIWVLMRFGRVSFVGGHLEPNNLYAVSALQLGRFGLRHDAHAHCRLGLLFAVLSWHVKGCKGHRWRMATDRSCQGYEWLAFRSGARIKFLNRLAANKLDGADRTCKGPETAPNVARRNGAAGIQT